MVDRELRDELRSRGGSYEAISDRYKELAPATIEILWRDFVKMAREEDSSIEYINAIQNALDDIHERARQSDSFFSKVSYWQTHVMPELVIEFAFAIPTSYALTYIVDQSPLVELGAFTGYWAYEINRQGGEITAYDIDPISDPWFPVKTGDQDLLLNCDDDETLILCWPPAGSMAYESLLLHDGDLIYIGELPGEGFKAFGDMRFFDVLEARYEKICRLSIPSHPGARDNLFHFHPKS